MTRLHPSRWPLALWVLLSLGGALLKVDYTLGSFSFATAAALLSGTWLGPWRAASVQAAASVLLVPVSLVFPAAADVGDWGFRLGLIAAAFLAGKVATPNNKGAHPTRLVRVAVFGSAGVTAGLVVTIMPRMTLGDLGTYFALIFLLGTALAVFYAYRMVPEPGRVIGYAFCLLPYYFAGVAWIWLLGVLSPATARAYDLPTGVRETVFFAYISHLTPELISLVVIAYLVCAVDGTHRPEGPLAIGSSR